MCHFADVSTGDRQKIRIYLYSIHVLARFRNFAEFRLVDDFDNASGEKKILKYAPCRGFYTHLHLHTYISTLYFIIYRAIIGIFKNIFKF